MAAVVEPMGRGCRSAPSVLPVDRIWACRLTDVPCGLRGTRGREGRWTGEAVSAPGETPDLMRRLSGSAIPILYTWGAGARALRDGLSTARVSHVAAI